MVKNSEIRVQNSIVYQYSHPLSSYMVLLWGCAMRTRCVLPLLMTALMLFSISVMLVEAPEDVNEETDNALQMEDVVYRASDPGHIVFSQYITSDNCGFCMDYGSPAHKKLKNDWGDKYTYVSLHSASYGDTDDAESGNVNPILAVNHLGETGGAPKTSFGDAHTGSGSYFMTGCGSNTCWDSGFSPGGRTHSSYADYSIGVGQSDNGDGTSTIDISVDYVGSGTAPLSSYTLYAAVTEETCHSHAYTNGYKGGHCWEAWLLNNGAYVSNSGNVGGGTGFETVSLASGTASASWTVPNNLVGQGASNMLTVAALYSGWSNSNSNFDVFTAADSSMNPMDLSMSQFTVTNRDHNSNGFIPGDILSLEATVANSGAEDYSAGGDIALYHVTGMNTETLIGQSASLNNLVQGATQTITAEFDTSGITAVSSGSSTFRAKLINTNGEKSTGNNIATSYMSHDVAPDVLSQPSSNSNGEIDRGDSIDFEVHWNSNDVVSQPWLASGVLEVTPSGQSLWSDDWVGDPTLIGNGTGNEQLVFTVLPPNTASSGDYDVRAMVTDARSQASDWSPTWVGAFTLMNGLPMVVNPNTPPGEVPGSCPDYPGQPTVKVDMVEQIDMRGLVCDAETPLSQLLITSNNPAFLGWYPASQIIEVQFGEVARAPVTGEVIPQGLQLSITDPEDENMGSLSVMVIENGAPRWAQLPSRSFDEGGSDSLMLTEYLSDTDESGNEANRMGLTVSVAGVDDPTLVEATVSGHTLNIRSVDDDNFGSTTITLRATDTDGRYTDTQLMVIVNNINDAPVLDVSSLSDVRLKAADPDDSEVGKFVFDVGANLVDIDDEVDLMFVTAVCDTWFVGSYYNPISGLLTARWEDTGTHTLIIVVEDSHGAENSYYINIEIIDVLPLVWSNNAESGDLMEEATDLYVGDNPSATLSYHGADDLSNIQIIWNICNSDTGICTDFGEEYPTQQQLESGFNFTATKTSTSGGLLFHDYITYWVEAVDQDGFDRRTVDDPKYVITEERPAEVVEEDDSTTSGTESGSSGLTGSTTMIAILATAIIGMIVAITLGLMLIRGGRSEPSVSWGADPSLMGDAPSLGSASDYTALPPGGSYITGETGGTVYLAPDGSNWDMQGDNSFIRTR